MQNLESWEHFTLFFTIDQIIMILHGDKRSKFIVYRIVFRTDRSTHSFRNWGLIIKTMAYKRSKISFKGRRMADSADLHCRTST